MEEQAIISKFNKEKTYKKNKADLHHIALAFLFFLLSLILFGCSPKTIYKQNIKEVYIPVKCNPKIPEKPKPTGSPAYDNINILAYARELEQTVIFCTKGD